jgi:thiamine pyrophosphokinase
VKKCVIFCAAGFDGLAAPIENNDIVIAADGGLLHTQRLGITPDVILGDFDSLGFVPEGANVFPVEKDDTDAMLAVRRGLAMGCREFLLYGSLDGKRLDHTVANFQTLQFLADHGAVGYLIGADHMVTVLKNGTLSFPPDADGILSVFCLGADASGVNIEGLQYILKDGTLSPGFPLGVSNHFIGSTARISVKHGSLLLIWDRKNGLPNR